MRVGQAFGELGDVFAREAAAQVIEAAIANHCQEPGAIGAAVGVEAGRSSPQGEEHVVDDVLGLATVVQQATREGARRFGMLGVQRKPVRRLIRRRARRVLQSGHGG